MTGQLMPAKPIRPPVKEFIRGLMDVGVSRKDAKQAYRELLDAEIWMNDTYTVHVWRELPPDMNPTGIPCVWLSIRRNDREPCRDWRDFQSIKNQLVGAECEAFELYPAESRVVDTANQFHLFVLTEHRVPLGFPTGSKDSNPNPFGNAVQRPMETHQ